MQFKYMTSLLALSLLIQPHSVFATPTGEDDGVGLKAASPTEAVAHLSDEEVQAAARALRNSRMGTLSWLLASSEDAKHDKDMGAAADEMSTALKARKQAEMLLNQIKGLVGEDALHIPSPAQQRELTIQKEQDELDEKCRQIMSRPAAASDHEAQSTIHNIMTSKNLSQSVFVSVQNAPRDEDAEHQAALAVEIDQLRLDFSKRRYMLIKEGRKLDAVIKHYEEKIRLANNRIHNAQQQAVPKKSSFRLVSQPDTKSKDSAEPDASLSFRGKKPGGFSLKSKSQRAVDFLDNKLSENTSYDLHSGLELQANSFAANYGISDLAYHENPLVWVWFLKNGLGKTIAGHEVTQDDYNYAIIARYHMLVGKGINNANAVDFPTVQAMLTLVDAVYQRDQGKGDQSTTELAGTVTQDQVEIWRSMYYYK